VIEVIAVDGHGRLTTRIYPVYSTQSWGLSLFGVVGSGGIASVNATVWGINTAFVDQITIPTTPAASTSSS
jgi:hypothetical protein